MIYPRLYKTEQGEVINLAMITQMYKCNDTTLNICVVKLVGGDKCTVTEKEMEQIYHSFKVFELI